MEIIAYTSEGCYYCDQLHELFRRADVKYTAIKVLSQLPEGVEPDNDKNLMLRSDFQTQFPAIYGFPYVIIDGKPIGALIETAKFLMKEGLVSAKKR
tara:strand:+ start:744 stop:1034 length:291 start_codon:yes stop_codon:yes gene_type:complete